MTLSKQIKHLVRLIAAAAVMGGLTACASSSTPAPTIQQVSFSAVTELPANEPAEIIRYGDAPAQFAELWLPADTSEPVPVVAFIHGGCWLNAYDISHSHPLASALADAGFAVWNIEYRRAGDAGGGWPGSLQDVQTALARLAQRRDDRLEQQRLVIAGHSAGGHLALLAAPLSMHESTEVIGLAAITDIKAYAASEGSCQQGARQFMGGGPEQAEHLAKYQAANPATLYQAELGERVTLLFGDADNIVPVSQSELIGARSIPVADAGHFDFIHPLSPAFAAFLQTLERQLAR